MSNTISPEEADEVLKNFMEEFFDFDTLKKAGFYGKEIKRKDYKAQAARICHHFGYKTVYEYGATEVRCHITDGDTDKPFVTVVPSIYE